MQIVKVVEKEQEFILSIILKMQLFFPLLMNLYKLLNFIPHLYLH